MVDRNDTLLREVDEELRRERFEKLWKQYSTHILIGAGVFVALVGAYKVWETRRLEAAQKAGAGFSEARQLIADKKPDEAAKVLDTLAKGNSTGFASLARLQLAASNLKAGKNAEALADFEAVGKDSSADVTLKEFAQLQAAALRLGEADWTEMQNRLNPLAGEKSPWRQSARELLGQAALKAGRMDDARATFQQLLADRNTPPGIAERARIAMSRVVEAELAKATTPAPAPAAAAGDGKAAAKDGAAAASGAKN